MAKHEPEVNAILDAQKRQAFEGHVKPLSDALTAFINQWTEAEVKFLVAHNAAPKEALEQVKKQPPPSHLRALTMMRILDLLITDYFAGVKLNPIALGIADALLQTNYERSKETTINAILDMVAKGIIKPE